MHSSACGGNGGITAVIVTLDAIWQLHALIALPQGKRSRHASDMAMGGHRRRRLEGLQ